MVCWDTEANTMEPRRPPRRMKSLSEALDSLGHSFHNIIHHSKHSHDRWKSSDDLKGKMEGSCSSSSLHSNESGPANGHSNHHNNYHSKHISLLKRDKKAHVKEAASIPAYRSSFDHYEINPNPSPTEHIDPFKHRVKASSQTNGSHKDEDAYKKEKERRTSDAWVASVTEDSADENDFYDEEHNPELNIEVSATKKSAKFYFDETNEPPEDDRSKKIYFEEEEENLHAHKKHGSMGKKNANRRRDSVAPGLLLRRASKPADENNLDPRQGHRNVDDLIFDMFREKEEDIILMGKFLSSLERTGLRKTDPRLNELMENLRQEERKINKQGEIMSIETLKLDRESFKLVITDNIVLISRAFRQQFVIPEFQMFCGHIKAIYDSCKSIEGGKVATYIPQLARADPDLWGVSICTIDGQRHSIGDVSFPFTVQSCSKPLTYAIALNELGEETVHQYVGQEPSGRMFNELILDYNKKPHNPMVNAGAIIVCSLLKSMVRPELTLAEKFDFTQQYFKRLGGGEYVGFNNAVFLSEREAADRNYALGFYMREHRCFPEGTNLKECMDYYFQCCSMETNCETAAVMAATLANGGVCPISGEKVLKSDSVRDVLSLMHSCGMYDYSGQFAFKVGLPAKSGVSGCIILVVPNVLGMAIYSPPLDALGNTVRGVSFCQQLVEVFNFHKYDNLRHASHKIDPRRHRFETKGLNIVNLLFSAASGDVTSMRRHHLSGMDMGAVDYDGRSALHLAAAEGHLECVQYLLSHCYVNPTPLDRWGHTPLDEAKRFEHEDVCEFLQKWDKSGGH